MPPPARGKGHCCDELRRSRRLCRTWAYVSIVLADEMDALTIEPSGSNDVQWTLEYRRTENGAAFMVIDPEGRPVPSSELVGKSLGRSEVIGTPLAQIAFDLVDAIWLQDERIAEVVGADPTR